MIDTMRNPLSDLSEVKTYDYPIGGKLIVASATFADHLMVLGDDGFRDAVRSTLTKQIVEKMIQEKLIEFTQAQDHATMNIMVRARAYVAPDSTVKILRTYSKL